MGGGGQSIPQGVIDYSIYPFIVFAALDHLYLITSQSSLKVRH